MIALLTTKATKVGVRIEGFMPLNLQIFRYIGVDDLKLGVAPSVHIF